MCRANSLQCSSAQSHFIWCQKSVSLWFLMPSCLQSLSGPQNVLHFEPPLEFAWVISSHGCLKDFSHMRFASRYPLFETTITDNEENSPNVVFNIRFFLASWIRHVVMSLSSRAETFRPFWSPMIGIQDAEIKKAIFLYLIVDNHTTRKYLCENFDPGRTNN